MRIKSAVLLCALSATPHLFAGVITYANRAAWLAASTGVTTQGFEGIAAPNSSVSENPAVTLSGITYTRGGALQDIYVVSGTYATYGRGSGDIFSWQHGAPIVMVNLTLPANITAFAADLSDLLNPSNNVTVSLSTGDAFIVPVTDQGLSFFGATSTTTISSVTLSIPAGDDGLLDNVSIGAAVPAAVPEPATLLLLSLALPVLAWRRRARAC